MAMLGTNVHAAEILTFEQLHVITPHTICHRVH